jgi:menaquinol-cytochrome c reductase iron-sulfur subunit
MQETEDRRGFLRLIIGGGAAVIGALTVIPGLGMLFSPVLFRAKRKQAKVVFQNPTDAGSESFVPARYEGQEETAPGIFYRKETDGRPYVISARCTHSGCPVAWKADDKKFFCACHQGYFDQDGKNVAGPPPRPLDRLSAQVVNDEVFVEEPEA